MLAAMFGYGLFGFESRGPGAKCRGLFTGEEIRLDGFFPIRDGLQMQRDQTFPLCATHKFPFVWANPDSV